MIFQFKTKTNLNGNTKHLIIDTDKKTIHQTYYFNYDCILIKSKDFKELKQKAINEGFKEV